AARGGTAGQAHRQLARGQGRPPRRRRGTRGPGPAPSRAAPAAHRQPGRARGASHREDGAGHPPAARPPAPPPPGAASGPGEVPALLDLCAGGRRRRRGLPQVPGGALVTGPGVEQIAAPDVPRSLSRDPALVRKLVVLYLSALALVLVDQWVKYEMVARLTTR